MRGSNNSFNAVVGMDYTWHAEQSQKNGEPGYIWLKMLALVDALKTAKDLMILTSQGLTHV